MIQGLALVALAIIIHAILKGYFMALDRTSIDNGLQAVSDALNALGAVIAEPNPVVGEAQAVLDDVGSKLETLASQVNDMKNTLTPSGG